MLNKSHIENNKLKLVLRGENKAEVPFVIWNNKIPDKLYEKRLLELGACIVVKSRVFSTRFSSIKSEIVNWEDEHQRKFKKIVYHTPNGNLEETVQVCTGSQIPVSYIFKSADDYEAIYTLIEDNTYAACYDDFLDDDNKYGEQGIARPATEKSPFYKIIYDLMGIENFSIEWFNNNDKVLHLFNLLNTQRLKRLQLVAKSPAFYCVIDGNIELSMIGNQIFEDYYIPCLEEACDILHKKGILTALHLDGNNKPLIDYVSKLPIDIIEAFTPPPDCDTTLDDALKLWPDKSFLVNYPSSLHLLEEEQIKKHANGILKQARNSGRVALGVIEDIPHNDYLLKLVGLIQKLA